MIDVGMAMAEIIVERKFQRKMKTTSAARSPPMIKCSSIACREFSINSDWSRTITNFRSLDRVGMTSAMRCLTARITATVFEPDCLRIANVTAAPPFRLEMELGSTPPSSTCPMSPILTE